MYHVIYLECHVLLVMLIVAVAIIVIISYTLSYMAL
jgi:hypothetical protein